jgi:hypothetical protein
MSTIQTDVTISTPDGEMSAILGDDVADRLWSADVKLQTILNIVRLQELSLKGLRDAK